MLIQPSQATAKMMMAQQTSDDVTPHRRLRSLLPLLTIDYGIPVLDPFRDGAVSLRYQRLQSLAGTAIDTGRLTVQN